MLAGLRRECPNGVDVYFDNVGGATLDAVLSLINLRARLVICGLISQYNAMAPVPGPQNLGNLLVQRARDGGLHRARPRRPGREGVGRPHPLAPVRRLKYRLDVVHGLEKAPAAVNRLFDGSNTGKLVVRVSEE